MWELGDTLIGELFFNNSEHLCIVLSDVFCDGDQESVVLVPVSTYRGACALEEDCCILHKGVHSFIKHTSYVVYSSASNYSVFDLNNLCDLNKCRRRERLAEDILLDVLDGVSCSVFMPKAAKKQADKAYLRYL